MNIEIEILIGSLAAIITTAAFIPQVMKAYYNKQTKDLSLAMLLIFVVGLVLWLVYGLLMNSVPVIMANIVTLFLTLFLLHLKIKHG
ncbi:MAG: SemiSWEET transporter [bacterium]